MRTLRRLFVSALGTTLLVGSAAAVTAQPAAAEPTDQFLFATGAGPGGGPHVRLFKADGTATNTSFYAFPAGFTGGVEVALGDLDGDGTPEIVTAAGPGGDAHVRIFDIHGTPIDKWSFYAYPNFHGGVHVATGDLNNDEYQAAFTAPAAGNYAMAFRAAIDGGPWTDCEVDGPHDSFAPLSAGPLVVGDTVSWCNLQFPAQVQLTGASGDFYGRVYQPGVTDLEGAGPGIAMEFGYGTAAGGFVWTSASFHSDEDGLGAGDHANDEERVRVRRR